MKRIIALFISVILLTFSCVNTSAVVDTEKLEEDYITYLDETLGEQRHGLIIIGDAFEENGVLFFQALCGHANFADACHKIIGGWYYSCIYTIGPGGLGLFVQSDGKIYDIETAYNTGIITDLTPTLKFSVGNSLKIYPNGDADGNCEVNIRDATAIQKYLVNLDSELICESVQSIILDTDKDGVITVRDATAIQKKLAGLSD